jgi:hypothetical protein
MGRPLRKDVLGVDAIGSSTGAATGVRVEYYDEPSSSLKTDGVIIKQRGAKTFTVVQVGNIGSGGKYVKAVLQNSTPNAANEMRMWGWLGGNGGTEINIAKITKNLVTDWSDNKYTWTLENDSSNDYIVLTAI